jgi:hypothetical protein
VDGKMLEEESYRWVLVPPPRAGILRLYVILKFTNGLLDSIEISIVIEKSGIPDRVGFIQVRSDEPDAYKDTVLDLITQLFDRFEVVEEHYSHDVHL